MVRLVPIHTDSSLPDGGHSKGRDRVAEDFDTLADRIAVAFGISSEWCIRLIPRPSSESASRLSAPFDRAVNQSVELKNAHC
jgi:hypothetical protein